MSEQIVPVVDSACAAFGNDPGRLMEIVRRVQQELRHVPEAAIDRIASQVGLPRVEVASVVSFYAFFGRERQGRVVIRLSDDILDRMAGYREVRAAFEDELGIRLGQTTPEGLVTLERTACIGMCDQAPAALVNEVPVTHLSSDKARRIVRELRDHGDPRRLVKRVGDGNNGHPLVHAMVENNIRVPGPIVFSPMKRGEAIEKALSMTPQEIIRAVKMARLRGRGGAGFPTGMKWEFARAAEGERKFVICNADEGEPGTFKDRVILTERADRVFAGLTIAGYAVGAREGIVYLRGEYAYLLPFLEDVLARRREDGLLGVSIGGKRGFDFDIRIVMGAGSYVCGEESALISSCEGLRGDPRTRPPFPAQRGYLGCPTVVNNVETLAKVTKILEEGPATFSAHGTDQSTGTKVLSIAGDCLRPGIYEVPMGIPLIEVLRMSGAEGAAAVQVGGPSGRMVGPAQFTSAVSFEHLATGGALMVFGPERDLLEVVSAFMEFFVDESCGYCTPCRVGNVLLKERLETIRAGHGVLEDLKYLEELGRTVKATSRCGLGQTSPHPILSSLEQFRGVWESRVARGGDGVRRDFSLLDSVKLSEKIAGRRSVHAGGGA
jgi:[NiFe] hydrogenase diaphorase moiety large subunit